MIRTLALSFIISSSAFAEGLRLSDYIKKVESSNDQLHSVLESQKSAVAGQLESQLVTDPQLVSALQWSSDAKPSPLIRSEKINTVSGSVGLQQQTSYGLQGKLSYSVNQIEYVGLVPKYWESRPQLELTQSLWRNGGGRETQATIEALRTASEGKVSELEMRKRMIYLEAESAYWRLALAREAVKVSQEALNRAQALFNWSSRRSKLELADSAENLQAGANLKARLLDLQQAQDEERSAALAFNLIRGISSHTVSESLTTFHETRLDKMVPTQPAERRPDIKAMEHQVQAVTAQSKISIEKNKPTLELFGLVALNGNKSEYGDAASASLKTDQPTYGLGIRLTAPLSQGVSRRIQEAYSRDATSASYSLQKKKLDVAKEWADLSDKYVQAQNRLKLALDLETAQKAKLDRERQRQQSGRSTMAQVLTFEVEFEQSQFLRLRTAAELLTIAANMKMFSDQPWSDL